MNKEMGYKTLVALSGFVIVMLILAIARAFVGLEFPMIINIFIGLISFLLGFILSKLCQYIKK